MIHWAPWLLDFFSVTMAPMPLAGNDSRIHIVTLCFGSERVRARLGSHQKLSKITSSHFVTFLGLCVRHWPVCNDLFLIDLVANRRSFHTKWRKLRNDLLRWSFFSKIGKTADQECPQFVRVFAPQLEAPNNP